MITNQLLCLIELHQRLFIPMNGASGRNRTTDTGIFSPLLYLLSYRSKTLATRKGLEPSTSSVTGWRTNQLYYRAKNILFCIWWAFRDLNPGPIGYEPTALTTELKARHCLQRTISGRGEEIRTPDPMVPNHVRYQTALHPDVFHQLVYLTTF